MNGNRWIQYGLMAGAGLFGVAVFYGMSAVGDAIAGAVARVMAENESQDSEEEES